MLVPWWAALGELATRVAQWENKAALRELAMKASLGELAKHSSTVGIFTRRVELAT